MMLSEQLLRAILRVLIAFARYNLPPTYAGTIDSAEKVANNYTSTAGA